MNEHPFRIVWFACLVIAFIIILSIDKSIALSVGSSNQRSPSIIRSNIFLPLTFKNYDSSRIPIFSWFTDFEDCGATVFDCGFVYDTPNRINEYSHYKIVDDPTGSGRGKLYRGVVDGGPPPVAEETNFGTRHRPYPDLSFPYLDGPVVSEMDIWIDTSEALHIAPANDDINPWFSPLSFFDYSGHMVVGSRLGVDERAGDQQFRVTLGLPYDEVGMDGRGTVSPIPFPLRTWVRLRLEVNLDRSVRLYQDGNLISEHRLTSESKVGAIAGHWGLYAWHTVRDLVVLNDNLRFEVYRQPEGLYYRYDRTYGETEIPYFNDTNHLNNPNGLVSDGTDIWIVECAGSRALKYTDDGAFVMQLGEAGLSQSDGLTFNCLNDVAVDDSGNILLVSNSHQVMKFDASGRYISSLGAPWDSGVDNNRFKNPSGVALDVAGRIYISDSGNHRIQIFNEDGIFLATLGVTGVPGSDNNHFNYPRHISIDINGLLYVADTNNHRVQVFNVSTPGAITYVATLGVSGVPGADDLHFDSPQSIAIDESRNRIFVADANNARVQIFNYSTRTYQNTLSGFNFIHDIAVDSTGKLYITERWLSHVQQFSNSLEYTRTYGTTNVSYLTDSYHYNRPSGVSLASDGSIYIGESWGQRLIKLNSAGVLQWIIGEPNIGGTDNNHFSFIEDVSLDTVGRVYVIDRGNCRVQIYNADGSYRATLGSGCGISNNQFNDPNDVAIGPNGNIYVADTGNHRVQVFNSNLFYITTLGQSGMAGDDNIHFDTPKGLAIDALGNIYIADLNNHRVQVFNNSFINIDTIGETGVIQDDSDHLFRPSAISIAPDGRIYVADHSNDMIERIQVFDPNGEFQATIRGRGGSRTGQLSNIEGLAIDAVGNVYVVEGDFHRIEKFIPIEN